MTTINCTACGKTLSLQTTKDTNTVKYFCNPKCQSSEMVSDYYFECLLYDHKIDLCFVPIYFDHEWICVYIDYLMNRITIYRNDTDPERVQFIKPNLCLSTFNQDVNQLLTQYYKLRAFQ